MKFSSNVKPKRVNKHAANKHRSAGICCAVYNCGIIVGITELFGCESLSHVYVFLTWLWYTIATFPKLFAYDDACHLKRFVNSRQKTAAGMFLASLTMVVDKILHHVDKWCKQNVNSHRSFCNLIIVCRFRYRQVVNDIIFWFSIFKISISMSRSSFCCRYSRYRHHNWFSIFQI